jgi:hypothetical protein
MYNKVKTKMKTLFREGLCFISRIYLNEILVIGDSHVVVFKYKKLTGEFKNDFFNVCEVVGATVSGLENPYSKTQALPIFERALNKTTAKKIIVSLGEVDTGFVIWFRAERNECSVEEMLDSAVNNYKNLIDKVALQAQVICISAPLPTISDDQDWGDIANLRKNIKATQKQRTDLTIAFNKMIEQYLNEIGQVFISLDTQAIGEDGVVSNHLLNPNPNDHHYCPTKYINMLMPRLKEIF